MSRLKEKYNKEIITKLIKKFDYKNVMQVPKLEKIIINVGCGNETKDNLKIIDSIINDISIITGQKAIPTKAKKSIANFKIRAGMPVGVKVTLRSERMWNFLDKLFNLVLPRVRDFRGINKKSFDGNGNFSFGVKEQLIFPEIKYDKIDKIRGMNIVICTTAQNDQEAFELLEQLGAPFNI